MTEEQYFELLRTSEIYCRSLPIYHIDFLHDVLVEKGLDLEDYKKAFAYRKFQLYEEPIMYNTDDLTGEGDKKHYHHINYIYCYRCNQMIPEGDSYTDNRTKCCKNCYNNKNVGRKRDMKKERSISTHMRTYRAELRDSYIKDLLKKNGHIYITEEMIAEKREQILKKRTKKLAGKM